MKPWGRTMKRGLPALVLGWCLTFPALAEPYRPAADDEVLESLPARGENWRELRELRQKVKENPADPGPAMTLVRRYVELGRAESDPRYYGHAEAVLASWLRAAEPSPEALTLRATLLQNRHEFAKALEDLSRALARQPRLAQAWLTRAVILEVQGNYPAALNSCLPLARLASPLTSAVCLNSALSLSGQGDFAYQRLGLALAQTEADGPEILWAQVTAAEIAERLGRFDEAERHYRKALGLNLKNAYLWATYADFLLDRERPKEVLNLLKNETRPDNLLLRLTLAEQRLGSPALSAHVDALKARFAASRLRGDTTHQGDEARFTLHLLNEPIRALELAKANWAVQREPRDARILLESALAAGRNDSAQPVLDFIAQSRLQDVRLRGLGDRIMANSR